MSASADAAAAAARPGVRPGTTGLSTFPADGDAVVVGASGGIGAAIADVVAASGRFGTVHRLARSGTPAVDVTDEASLAAAAERFAAAGRPLRLLVVASGLLHGEGLAPEKSLADLDPARLARAFAVNATGPALVLKHFAPHLPREGKAVAAAISAKVGSIEDNRIGGWYAYRASKAALNQLVRTAAIEIGRRRRQAALVALHPGTVDTALSQPFSKAGLPVQAPEDAAARLAAVLDGVSAADTGSFLTYAGERLPW